MSYGSYRHNGNYHRSQLPRLTPDQEDRDKEEGAINKADKQSSRRKSAEKKANRLEK